MLPTDFDSESCQTVGFSFEFQTDMDRPTLKLRDTGKDVRELKMGLAILNYLRKGEVNDQYDLHTKAAVEAFQLDEGLNETGECDADTWNAINKRIAEKVR